MDLSQLDKRILREISDNGVPMDKSVLAKKLRINMATLNYALKKLEKNRSILGYRYRIDYRKIGLSQISWIFISVKEKSIDVDTFMNSLLEIPQIHLVVCVTGEYDIVLKVFSQNIETTINFLLDLQKKFNAQIKDSVIYFVGRTFKWHQISMETNVERIYFDETDLSIASYKFSNPQKSIIECSNELGIHRNTVSARWKKFVDQKMIMKKSAIINPEHFYDLGRGFNAFVFVKSESGETEKLVKLLCDVYEIHEVCIINHAFDILLVVRVADVPSFYEFHNRLMGDKKISSLIRSTNSVISLHSKMRKHTYLKDLPPENFLYIK